MWWFWGLSWWSSMRKSDQQDKREPGEEAEEPGMEQPENCNKAWYHYHHHHNLHDCHCQDHHRHDHQHHYHHRHGHHDMHGHDHQCHDHHCHNHDCHDHDDHDCHCHEYHHLESVSFAHFWNREEEDCGEYANLNKMILMVIIDCDDGREEWKLERKKSWWW